MKILIYGINYSPESIGIGKYTGEMASWFAKNKNEVKVITAPPYYPDWQIRKGFKNKYSDSFEDDVHVIRCPLFVPSNPSTLNRLLHLISFSISSIFPVMQTYSWKPDVVIQVVPTLFCSLQTILIARLTKSKAIIHIQDFEIDAMFGLSMIRTRILQRIAHKFEKFILNRFDFVSTISIGMKKRANKKGVKNRKLILFPNWSEVERFQNIGSSNFLHKKLSLTLDKKIILYSGNIGKKQGLDIVIKAAKAFERTKDFHFVIVGEGSDKANLVNLSQQLSLKNIAFLPLQPYKNLPELLASADCHLVIQKFGAADAVLPSKLTNILAVGGNVVITAEENTTLGYLCNEFKGIATLVNPESIPELCEGIKKSLSLPKCNSIAQKYAQNNLNKDKILSKFLLEIQ